MAAPASDTRNTSLAVTRRQNLPCPALVITLSAIMNGIVPAQRSAMITNRSAFGAKLATYLSMAKPNTAIPQIAKARTAVTESVLPIY